MARVIPSFIGVLRPVDRGVVVGHPCLSLGTPTSLRRGSVDWVEPFEHALALLVPDGDRSA